MECADPGGEQVGKGTRGLGTNQGARRRPGDSAGMGCG